MRFSKRIEKRGTKISAFDFIPFMINFHLIYSLLMPVSTVTTLLDVIKLNFTLFEFYLRSLKHLKLILRKFSFSLEKKNVNSSKFEFIKYAKKF